MENAWQEKENKTEKKKLGRREKCYLKQKSARRREGDEDDSVAFRPTKRH